MPHLVNHDANEKALLCQRVGPATVVLQRCPRAVEGNHRVFHTAHEADIDRLRRGVRIVE